MERFFSARHLVPESSPASRPSPTGSLRSALTPGTTPGFWAATRKTLAKKPGGSGWDQGLRMMAREKEHPRPGYEVCESKTLVSRLRQLPTDQLSCGKTRAYQNGQSSKEPVLDPCFHSLRLAGAKELEARGR